MGGYAMTLVQDFTIDKYGWYVKVYYVVDHYPVDDIVNDMYSLGCDEQTIWDNMEAFESEILNDGFIHSNAFMHRSLIVIGPTSSAEEFLDTWDHEKGHLAMHICITEDINPMSEEYQYLTGYIGKQMFKVAKIFLCDECRTKLYK